jgi:hypothetical protein
MNDDPNSIRLEGHELDFWRRHSDFLDTFADLSNKPGILVLRREDKPFLENDIHFNFFWDIVHGVPVAKYKEKNGSFRLKTEKGYTISQIREFLDFIGYDRYSARSDEERIRRFKKNVLEHLNTNIGEEQGFLGHGTGKPRKTLRRRRYYYLVGGRKKSKSRRLRR